MVLNRTENSIMVPNWRRSRSSNNKYLGWSFREGHRPLSSITSCNTRVTGGGGLSPSHGESVQVRDLHRSEMEVVNTLLILREL